MWGGFARPHLPKAKRCEAAKKLEFLDVKSGKMYDVRCKMYDVKGWR